MLVLKTIFWLSVFGLFYIYLGYPLLIWLLAMFRPRPVKKGECNEAVSVVIAAHNEESVISRKLGSLLASRSAHQIAEVLIGSDGSTDRTAAACREVGDARIRVVEFPERRGKASVLNDLIPQCKSAIVVLTDARQDVHPDAIGALLSNFADAEVGVVSGGLVFRSSGADGGATAAGMGAYWAYEKLIRKSESRAGSVPGATGALYAVRKELAGCIPAETVLDDVAIPMLAIEKGSRCVFEDNAFVYDLPSETLAQESVRKRRTLAGNAQLIALFPRWLVPWRNPIWFSFVSHKMARLASPLLLAAMLLTNIGAVVCGPVYSTLLILQCVFYVFAAAGRASKGRRRSVFGLPFLFMALNAATFLGVLDALRGRVRPAWRRSVAQ